MDPGSRGECLFCSAKGKHKYLDKEYFCYGNREIYIDLIMECYGIQIGSSTTGSKLICLSCVERLREAVTFKELVLQAERRMHDPLSLITKKDDYIVNIDPSAAVKEEEIEYYDDGDNDVGIQESDHSEDRVPGELELLRRFPAEPLAPSMPKVFKMYCHKFRGKTITSEDVKRILMKTEEIQPNQTSTRIFSEKMSYITNMGIILECTNATPFRGRTGEGFNCFYCSRPFQNMRIINKHIQELHKNESIKKTLWRYGTESIKMYIDVTDLKCALCNKDLEYKDLKRHLESVHKRVINNTFSDRVIPFYAPSITDFKCVLCEAEFVTFGAIERHMNGHYRNYICKLCGSGYVTKLRLKVHITSVHTAGAFPCNLCKKTFPTQQKKDCHQRLHVTRKRFRCPHCSLRFNEYFTRAKHMTLAHGVKPLVYNCKVCEKTFERGNQLTRHMKRDHLEHRDFKCEICPYTCFSSAELKYHLIKHNGERIFECHVCKKAYARRKTLMEHLRIHNNDRRHVCPVCGQAFVQKCSLKGHVKTHHPDFVWE